MQGEESFLLAGGTFVLNHLKKAKRYPLTVVGLKKISSLRGVEAVDNGCRIGAMTTVAELCESPLIREGFPSLFEAGSKLATTPVRNMATVGGNVACRFFWTDLSAVLISLKAELSLLAPAGKKRISVEDFLIHKPQEKFLATDVFVPERGRRAFYFRHTRSMEVDVPSLALAVSLREKEGRLSDARCVVNTAVSFPVSLPLLQKVFEGKRAADLKSDDARKALREDLKEKGLDDHRLYCLELDLETLLECLKTTKP